MTKEQILNHAKERVAFSGKFVKTNKGYHVNSWEINHAKIAPKDEIPLSAGSFTIVNYEGNENYIFELKPEGSSTLKLNPDSSDEQGLARFFGITIAEKK